jgi:DNA-directed RNA polymerase sigma subunit (sigma70/sigma32)
MKKKSLKVISDKTCFSLHEYYNVDCQKKSCNNWISYSSGKNCVIIASKAGPKTLQEIGKIYNLTRMRICQIEKNIYEKVKNLILQE